MCCSRAIMSSLPYKNTLPVFFFFFCFGIIFFIYGRSARFAALSLIYIVRSTVMNAFFQLKLTKEFIISVLHKDRLVIINMLISGMKSLFIMNTNVKCDYKITENKNSQSWDENQRQLKSLIIIRIEKKGILK